MTFHSALMSWTFGDEVTDEVVAEVVKGLFYNKQYNRGAGYTPESYWVSCHIDAAIFRIGRFLDSGLEKEVSKELVNKFVSTAPNGTYVLVERVLEELGYSIG